MGIKRSDIPWRELPHLRIDEVVELSGFCRRTITTAIKKGELSTRQLAKIPVIPTKAFRLWIGEQLRETDPQCEPTATREIEARADRILRRLG